MQINQSRRRPGRRPIWCFREAGDKLPGADHRLWHLGHLFAEVDCEQPDEVLVVFAEVSATATFPLPLPHPGVWRGGGPGFNRRKLHQLAQRRLLHVVVMALNYHFCGGPPSLVDLRRLPNAWQLSVFERLRSSLFACGTTLGQIPLSPGCSGPQLVAALGQLEVFCERHLRSGRYDDVRNTRFEDDAELFPSEKYPQLSPYKQLDVSRLKIVGGGNWPMEQYLQGSIFWLPYQEPAFLWHDFDTSAAKVPNFDAEVLEENLRLARLWDSRGLLRIFDRPLRPGFFSRVFNAYKSPEKDRQIGDRRLPNCEERHIDGPSAFLPQGQLLCNIWLPRFKVGLRGSITDRRDFYHQAEVSMARAQSNLLPFEFPRSYFPDFDFDSNFPAKKKKADRGSGGDGFGDRFYGGPLPSASDGCYVGFGSLFQGDHLGVEFALAFHEALMTSKGLLAEERRVRGHALFPITADYEGLIIDDYFYLSSQPIKTNPKETTAYRALAEARHIYSSVGLEGSPEKDVVAEDVSRPLGPKSFLRRLWFEKVWWLLGLRGKSDLPLDFFPSGLLLCPAFLEGLHQGFLGIGFQLCYIAGASARLSPISSGLLQRLRVKVMVLGWPRWHEQLLRSWCSLQSSLPLWSQILLQMWPLGFSQQMLLWKRGPLWRGDARRSSVTTFGWAQRRRRYTKLSSGFAAALAALGEEPLSPDDGDAVDEIEVEGPYKSPLMYYDFIELYGGAGVVSKHALAMVSTAGPVSVDSLQPGWCQAFGMIHGDGSLWPHQGPDVGTAVYYV